MPGGLKRCGKCVTCKERVCNKSRGTGCPGCLDDKRKEGCHFRRLCVKQPSHPPEGKSYVTTDGGTTSASEGENVPRYLTRHALSSSSDHEGVDDSVSTPLLEVSKKMEKNLQPLSLPELLQNPIITIGSDLNIPNPDNALTLDSSNTSSSTVVPSAESLPAQKIEFLFPHSESIWEMTDPNQAVASILRNPRRESALHTPLNAEFLCT